MQYLGFLAIVAASSAAACAASTGDTGGFGGSNATASASAMNGSGSGATTTVGATMTSTATGLSPTVTVGAGGAGTGGSGPAIIYAHTDTTLFQLDPTSTTLSLTQLGDFDCIGGSGQDSAMTDVAVNKDQELWAVSHTAVHSIQLLGNVAHCTTSISLNNPKGVSFYGLTFAPAGVLDPAKEVLVAGNTDGELWEIDSAGNLSEHGTFGTVPPNDGNGHTYSNSGKNWELSGDIVFLANSGSPVGFATVRDCSNPPSSSNCDAIDTLIEINVGLLATATTNSVTKTVRGQIVKGASCSDGSTAGYGSMYGIAAWNDKVYGFSRKGDLVEINTDDGSACRVQSYASDKFAGAGVTTLAPIKTPPPK